MSNVTTRVLSGNNVGNEIDDELLGVNMRFHHNRTDENSDFRQVMDHINTSSIRYAGGTISEEHFDLANPNATSSTNIMHIIHPELIPARTNGVPVTRQITPLTDYLDYVNELDGEPVIVLPTYRYFDQATRGLTAGAEAEIRGFVRDLFQDVHGDVDKVTLEIGNEYFQHFRFDWTLAEFGALQARIAGWVDDEVTRLGLRDDLTLLAQGAHVRNNNPALTEADNAALAGYFQNGGRATVDGVILHFYGTNAEGNPMDVQHSIREMLAGTNRAWSDALGRGFDIAVTEWNMGESGESTTTVNGLMRTAPLLQMFAEMVRGGVDLAQLWAARTDGPAGLSLRREDGDDLTPTGYFMKMLSESVHGLRLVDPGTSGHWLTNSGGNRIGFTYTFEDEDRSVIYLASARNSGAQISVNLNGLAGGGAHVYARKLGAAPGDSGNGYWSEAQITHDSDVTLVSQGGTRFYEARLGAYELIELHIVRGEGVVKEGDTGNDVRDNLIGTGFDDVLSGNGGWDRLDGGRGDDELHGGNGKDILRGKQDDDALMGDSGHDHLMGGAGNDLLYGGTGKDRLMGQDGDDQLYGGAGRDRLFGGNGQDTLNGGIGHDALFGGAGDDLLVGDKGADTLEGGAGDDLLEGGLGADILRGGVGDDVLEGGAGDDVLSGGAGDDMMTGGNGADRFVFTEGDASTDRITDFGTGADRIDLSDYALAGFAAVAALATDTGAGVRLDLAAEQSVQLDGVALADLAAEQFIF